MSRPSSPRAPPAYASSAVSAAALDEQVIDACCRRFEQMFRDEPYYSAGRTWDDYAPAYCYALRVHGAQHRRRFADIAPELAHEWEVVRGPSRLTWAEARPAMEAAWSMARSRAPR